MQYHALSLASHGRPVDLIGYTGAYVKPQLSSLEKLVDLTLNRFSIAS